MTSRIGGIVLAGMLTLFLGSCGNVEPLRIGAIWGFPGAASPAADASLRSSVEKTVTNETGVACTWTFLPEGTGTDEYLQETLGTGALPEVLLLPPVFYASGYGDSTMAAQLFIQQDLVWKLTPELIEKYMPNYAARIRKYGQTVEKVLDMNKVENENLYLPVHLAFGAFPGLIDHAGSKDPGFGHNQLCFRDDILKMIYPNARTEAELQALLLEKGSLSVEDIIGDIPITSLEDLHGYLAKVKALDLKVGGSPVIPGTLASASIAGEKRLDSIDWSLRSMAGFRVVLPITRGDPPDWQRTEYPRLSPEFKNYLAWWNTLSSEGLTDPDLFDLSMDELVARQVEGRYAVINNWYWAGEARAAAKERGYGYRYLPVFYGRLKDIWDNYTLAVSLEGDPLVFTKSISEKDLPKVLKWADWYLGEERDALAYWGMPGWYRGKGAKRTYKPAYAALADWAVYGIPSDRDGSYYGLESTPAVGYDPSTSMRLPLGPIAFFPEILAYPDAPFYVYRKEPSKLLQTMDIAAYCDQVLTQYRYDHQIKVIYVGPDLTPTLWALPEWYQYETTIAGEQAKYDELLLRMVRGRPADFERAYAAWIKMMQDAGIDKARQASIDSMTKIYPEQIVPNILRDTTKSR